jgi:hypothetical protein
MADRRFVSKQKRGDECDVLSSLRRSERLAGVCDGGRDHARVCSKAQQIGRFHCRLLGGLQQLAHRPPACSDLGPGPLRIMLPIPTRAHVAGELALRLQPCRDHYARIAFPRRRQHRGDRVELVVVPCAD